MASSKHHGHGSIDCLYPYNSLVFLVPWLVRPSFFFHSTNVLIFLLVYVDDILVTGNN